MSLAGSLPGIVSSSPLGARIACTPVSSDPDTPIPLYTLMDSYVIVCRFVRHFDDFISWLLLPWYDLVLGGSLMTMVMLMRLMVLVSGKRI